jgi:hypothetical protein
MNPGAHVQRRNHSRVGPRRLASLQIQVREDLLDHRSLQDGGDKLQFAAELPAASDS